MVIEFIDKFYDKYDVVSDLRKYLPLFSKDMDAPALAFFIKTERLRLVEEAEESKNQNGTTGRNSVDDFSSLSNSSFLLLLDNKEGLNYYYSATLQIYFIFSA